MKIDALKVSRIAAKTSLRLFVILVLAACVPFINNPKMDHMSFIVHSKWTFISPAVLVVAFIVLLILTLKNKYSKADINWLFTLDTIILIVYGVTLYLHLFGSMLGH